MEAAAVRPEWTFAQKGIVALAIGLLAWSLAGFIAEPSFSTGDSAPTERVLWVDFNGWHALSGLLLLAPAFFFATRPRWAVLYALYAGGLLVATGIWALFDNQPGYVLTFPNNESDGVFHLASGSAFLVIAAVQLRRDRASG